MQCTQATKRILCSACNAYNPAHALRAAFATAYLPEDALPPDSPAAPRKEGDPLVRRVALGLKAGQHRRHGTDVITQNTMLPDEWKEYMAALRENIVRETARKQHDPDYVVPEGRKRFCDYPGRVILPPEPIVPVEESPPPWAFEHDYHSSWQSLTGHENLAKEIKIFANYMEPTFAERSARLAVIADVKAILDEVGKKGTMDYEMFGSETTGLATPLSDIDFRVWDTTGRENQNPSKMAHRMALVVRYMMTSDRWVTPRMRKGIFPIINAQHKASGIDVQIVASRSTERQQNVTTKLLSEIPNLRELFLVVRTFFDIRGMVDVYAGGLGSYSIFIMLAASLQQKHPVRADFNLVSGCQLTRFFKFYKHLRTFNRGVRVSLAPYFKKHDAHEAMQKFVDAAKRRGDEVRAGQWSILQKNEFIPFLLCLQDPADPFNDLTRKTYAIRHVTATISQYHDIIRDYIFAVDKFRGGRRQRPVLSMLTPLVGDCHNIYADRRRLLRQFGQDVMDGRWTVEQTLVDRLAEKSAEIEFVPRAEGSKEEQLEALREMFDAAGDQLVGVEVKAEEDPLQDQALPEKTMKEEVNTGAEKAVM